MDPGVVQDASRAAASFRKAELEKAKAHLAYARERRKLVEFLKERQRPVEEASLTEVEKEQVGDDEERGKVVLVSINLLIIYFAFLGLPRGVALSLPRWSGQLFTYPEGQVVSSSLVTFQVSDSTLQLHVSEGLRAEEEAFLGSEGATLMEVDTSEMEEVDQELLLFTRQLSLKHTSAPQTISHEKSELSQFL